MIEAIVAGLVLALGAFTFTTWLVNRRQRAAFIATLTDNQRAGLRLFEALRGWGSWREFATYKD
jgi:hypothetical protein